MTYDGLDDVGAGRGESIVEHSAAIGGIVDGESGAAAGVGEGGEVNGIKLASVFRIAEKNHLLPLDLAEGVVLDDDHFDGQPIFNCSNEIGHQHGETAVAYEGHYLPAGIGDLRGDGVGQSGGHGGEVAAQGVLLPSLDGDVTRPPG